MDIAWIPWNTHAANDQGTKQTTQVTLQTPQMFNVALFPAMRPTTERTVTVIRVGDVLFKVHRFLLMRDSSAFANMFSMPNENDTGNQMVTDENPVILHDEIDDFKALCWIMYALPMVYMDQTDVSEVDISKIVSLYLIAHKYHFESHEKFARRIIQTHCSNIRDSSVQIQKYFAACPKKRLESLLRVACLTEEASKDSSFRPIIQEIWLFRLEHNTNSSISYPLGVAETLGLRTFMGQLYNFALCSVMDAKQIEGSTAYARPAKNLTESQKSALFQGYWSLQQYWSNITNAPLKHFKCPKNQGYEVHTNHICNRVWKEFWPKYKIDTAGKLFSPFDFLKELEGKVVAMNKERFYDADISCIIPYVRGMVKELEDSLADHFLDPLPSSSSTS